MSDIRVFRINGDCSVESPKQLGLATVLSEAAIAEGAAKLTLTGCADTVCDRATDHGGYTQPV